MELVAFDLDGTLLNREQRLSAYTLETLERMKAAGIYYTIATGRTHHAAKACMQGHDFPYWQIFKNGVEWWNPETTEYHHRNLLSKSHITEILSSFEKHQVAPFVFCLESNGDHHVYHAPLNDILSQDIAHELSNQKSINLHPLDELPDTAKITNIGTMGKPEAANLIIQDSQTYDHLTVYSGGSVYREDAYWIDVHHSNVCKGSALMELKEKIGASKLIVFGDGDNDLSMFNVADESLATENALDHIKSAATNIIGHHDEDGVAKYLRKRYNL